MYSVDGRGGGESLRSFHAFQAIGLPKNGATTYARFMFPKP